MQCEIMEQTGTAWKHFISYGDPGTNFVRPEILQSWQRCYKIGVNPYDGNSHKILPQDKLKDLLERKSKLISIARPLMTTLYDFVRGSGFIVMLTDENSYIMEALGDPEILASACRLNFVPGGCWSEEQVGTNAIATAIEVGIPLQVSGEEHYCQKHHAWTCSGAPIYDDNNQIIGVLDMSGPSSETHKHTLGMVVAAVQDIRDQLHLHKNNQELSMANDSLSSIFMNISEGVILVDETARIKAVNPVAESILGQRVEDYKMSALKDILGKETPFTREMLISGKIYNDTEIRVDTQSGKIHCLASGRPIRDYQGIIRGGVILLSPMNKVQHLVNRFSGAQARFYFSDIIGSSETLKKTIKTAARAAMGMSNVLLEGESGTGKEIFAQSIHNHSTRPKGPFVAVNCGAIPRELIGSELFGYSEGAFTGAKRGGRPGKFEMACGGTLFLDEIGDMPLEQQVALLRVLQEKTITRIGDHNIIPVDVRIICATNQNLLEQVAKGNFRQDLYYRLNVISIKIPPLRQRREDISDLFYYFMNKIKKDTSQYELDPQLVQILQLYDWPGNVRELQNVVERMVNITDGPLLTIEHLPLEIYNHTSAAGTVSTDKKVKSVSEVRRYRKQMVKEKERQQLLVMLERCGGNISCVARKLGVDRSTIYRKMLRYNIQR
ncbi:MAG: sigma-54-dependent Fis family transcriptional regulator [Syntrophomonadaceae bacterium]|nr:sigma-54-dependent Fis family transcriptional regulator [Syntrophomonadaceae bacterium]MDD3889357.1 sigma-54-dependent Fis family transcriptional regulator [Syntrophomonadaceae bacterium]